MHDVSIYQRIRSGTAFAVALVNITAFLPFFLTHTALAATPSVYINEIASAANPEWVELYASTETDMSGWKVQFDDSTVSQTVTLPTGTVIGANGFYVVETPNNWLSNSGDTIQLYDATHSLLEAATVPANSNASLSHARSTDGGSWAASPYMQTKGTSNNPVFAAPSVTITPATTTVKSGDPDFLQIDGTISDADQLTYSLTVTDPSQNTTQLSGGGPTSTVSYGWDTSTLAGAYTLTLTATDSLNQSGHASVQVYIDRTIPVATLPDLRNEPAFGGTSDRNTVTLTGACNESPCTLHYTLDAGTGAAPIQTTTLDLQERDSNGVLVYKSGTYKITLIATDQAGNQSIPAETSFTVDNTAPGVDVLNSGIARTGGTVQPDVRITNPDAEQVTYNWIRAINSPNGGALDTTEADTMQPTFVPKTAGQYRYILTVCDALQNCSSAVFSFTWEPSVVPIADVAIASATLSMGAPPAGLVATKFNTTRPTTLGATNSSSAQVSSTATSIKDDPAPKKSQIEITDADNSSNQLWAILFVFALTASGYYAYRNWQLTRSGN